MATFAPRLVVLPGYLEKWPVLRSLEDVDVYCTYSKHTEASIRVASREVIGESARMRVETSHVDAFHRNLRMALARG